MQLQNHIFMIQKYASIYKKNAINISRGFYRHELLITSSSYLSKCRSYLYNTCGLNHFVSQLWRKFHYRIKLPLKITNSDQDQIKYKSTTLMWAKQKLPQLSIRVHMKNNNKLWLKIHNFWIKVIKQNPITSNETTTEFEFLIIWSLSNSQRNVSHCVPYHRIQWNGPVNDFLTANLLVSKQTEPFTLMCYWVEHWLTYFCTKQNQTRWVIWKMNNCEQKL